MPKVQLDISHSLSREEARSRLDQVTSRLADEYSAQCRWEEDDRLVVSRKGLHAAVNVEDTCVRVYLDLGLLMAPLAGSIRAGISRRLTELLA